jgi:hypothetical protein
MREWLPTVVLTMAGFLLAPLAFVVAQPTAPCQQYGCEEHTSTTTLITSEDTHERALAEQAFDSAQDTKRAVEGEGSNSDDDRGVLAAESDTDESSPTTAPDTEARQQADKIGELSGEVSSGASGTDGQDATARIKALPDTGGIAMALFGAPTIVVVGILLLRTVR